MQHTLTTIPFNTEIYRDTSSLLD